MNKLPLARTTDIVVQTLGKEILIYDLNSHKAYNLNETSSIIYQACDGKTTFAELNRKHNFTDEIIFLALDALNKENLLEKSEEYNSLFNGLSRREAIRKVGFASMIALPVIASLVAPTAAMAQSAGGGCPPFQGTCGTAGCCPLGSCAGNVTCCASGTIPCGTTCCVGGAATCNAGVCTPIIIIPPF